MKVTIGDCTLYLGDCRDILPTLAKGSVDAVVTSPPYNHLGERMPSKPTGMHAETRWVTNTRAVGYADDMPESEYQKWLNAILSQCASVCRPGASLFVNHKCRWRSRALLHPVQWIEIVDCDLHQEIIWARAGSTTLNARKFAPSEERILWFINCGDSWTWNQHAASWLSVWRIVQDNDANEHPCPFPQEIPTRCIEATTKQDDTVLEPFMGSGTTGVACVNLGRKFIGIELEPKYFDIACRRIEKAYADKANPLFGDVAPKPIKQETLAFSEAKP